MKVLVINGSPKGNRSNTYKLTKAFLAGMEEALQAAGETLEAEELQVNQLDIHPCLGCFSCWSKTPGSCCIQDDMQEVIHRLLWADITIWSFPLYYFTVPGGLKNLIDRQLPMVQPFMVENETQTGNGSHPARYDMSGKKTVVISTCGFYTAKGNYDGVCSLFDHICGKDGYTTVFCGQGELFRVPALTKRTNEYLECVCEAGKEYIAGEILPETRAKLDQLLYPRGVFENWADLSWGVGKTDGERESDALVFTREMAVLYRKESYTGKEQVLEMYYTDVDECYQIVMGRTGSRVVTDGSVTATTRIETPLSLWRSIAAGEIRGDEAVKKTAGIMHVPVRETNMNIMLIPWMAFWISVGIRSDIGSYISIGAFILVPLCFYRNKKTLYDVLSAALVGGCSLAVLMGAQMKSYIGAVNSVLPILMGVFTVWFQKWYPMRVASGR